MFGTFYDTSIFSSEGWLYHLVGLSFAGFSITHHQLYTLQLEEKTRQRARTSDLDSLRRLRVIMDEINNCGRGRIYIEANAWDARGKAAAEGGQDGAGCMIVKTDSYMREQVSKAVHLRATTEGIEIRLGTLEGEKNSLRYALQLLTPALVLVVVAEMGELFLDAKTSAGPSRRAGSGA
ncbi:hypothetical protein BD779DRAFT_1679763 [Infundibulicybe gibba]|nr:hypothetical protein BD779DRAFT_1679763 [Infundibulicybe gibba]